MDANDLDVLPALATFETFRWIVVTAITCDDCYLMTIRSEGGGKIRKVLCRRDHIRVEALVEEQNFQPAGFNYRSVNNLRNLRV